MKLMLKGLIPWLGLLVALPTVAIALFYFWGSAGSTDKQNYAAIVNYAEGGLNEGAVMTLGEPVTIVSYNLGYLSGLANNTTTQTDRAFFEANQQRVVTALKGVKPDIVAFQEIDFGSKRSYNVDQAEAIAQATDLMNGAVAINWDKNYVPFPYWPPTAQFGQILSGQAVLTRLPFIIQKNSRLVLEKASKPFYYNAFALDRLAQVSEVMVQGKTVVVINVHLEAFEEDTRVSQTRFVRSLAEDYAKTQPVILLGDFNSATNRTDVEKEFSIQIMAQSEAFDSAVPEAKWGKASATFPANQPEYNLDYIWYTPDSIEPLKTEVVSAAGESSDHLPLMMEFRLKAD
jgi:endonuclease/exonuclease/phosphatase family metal-dependent hydrolase